MKQRIPKTIYSKEFREQAVKQVTEDGLSANEAARRLSLPPSTFANWVKVAQTGKLGEISKVLKNELVHHRRFKTRAEAIQAITEYIKIFYRRQCKQARLGYLSRAVFERQFHETDWQHESVSVHY